MRDQIFEDPYNKTAMNIDLILLPVFEGCNIKGVDLAPQRLLDSGLEAIFSKYHNVNIIDDIHFGAIDQRCMFDDSTELKYRDLILRLTTMICSRVSRSIASGNFPICIGGDHSIGAGSIAGNSKAHLGDISAIWFDAHPDINTPATSPSKNFHGMSFGAAMGYGDELICNVGFKGAKVKPENCYLLGTRAIDRGEAVRIRENNIFIVASNKINREGTTPYTKAIVEDIDSKNTKSVHFSIDVDVIDPEEFGAVNVPESGGISFDSAIDIIRAITLHPKVKSLDFVEYNPLEDSSGEGLTRCLTMLEEISKALAQRG